MNSLEKMIILLTDVKMLDKSQRKVYESESKLLEQAVEELPEFDKRVIKMAYYLEPNNSDTYESIAEEFNILVSAVYEAQTNALRLLRTRIIN